MKFLLCLRIFYVATIVFISMALIGCATSGDNESEIPWNAPQPWEGNLLHGVMGGGQ